MVYVTTSYKMLIKLVTSFYGLQQFYQGPTKLLSITQNYYSMPSIPFSLLTNTMGL